MLTSLQMVFCVIGILLIGGVIGLVISLYEKRKKESFLVIDFSDNFVAPKMLNSDISIDEVVEDFILLD